jgi:RNA polymerase-binding transcription factor DksA
LIDSRLRATRDGTYGACTSCGEPLGFIALTQMPWADQCQACAEAA